MKQVVKSCRSCNYYRPKAIETGICRVEKKEKSECPNMHHNDSCKKWYNWGQQHYIRVGWVKRQKAELEQNE